METNKTECFTFIESCPSCSSNKFEHLHTETFQVFIADSHREEEAKLLRCTSCGFAFTHKYPNENYYHELYADRNQRLALQRQSLDQRKRLINQQAKKIILKHKASGDLFGCRMR